LDREGADVGGLDLRAEAERRGIVPPTAATCRRYGLTVEEWLALLASQDWACPVCRKRSGVRWNTDHDHVVGWKRMTPAIRKRFVRGILCAYCNYRRVNSRMSAEEAGRIAAYLAAYEARRDAATRRAFDRFDLDGEG
jgi:hypothetical protein